MATFLDDDRRPGDLALPGGSRKTHSASVRAARVEWVGPEARVLGNWILAAKEVFVCIPRLPAVPLWVLLETGLAGCESALSEPREKNSPVPLAKRLGKLVKFKSAVEVLGILRLRPSETPAQ